MESGNPKSVGIGKFSGDNELSPTKQDLNFYAHELREFVRYRNLGFAEGGGADFEMWNNLHTATLEDLGLLQSRKYRKCVKSKIISYSLSVIPKKKHLLFGITDMRFVWKLAFLIPLPKTFL